MNTDKEDWKKNYIENELNRFNVLSFCVRINRLRKGNIFIVSDCNILMRTFLVYWKPFLDVKLNELNLLVILIDIDENSIEILEPGRKKISFSMLLAVDCQASDGLGVLVVLYRLIFTTLKYVSRNMK